MRKSGKKFLAALLSASMILSAGVLPSADSAKAQETSGTTAAADVSNLTEEHTSANGITTKDNGQMRKELTSADFMANMGLGWNYGNSLEQSIDTSTMSESEAEKVDVEYCETSAGNRALTQKNVDTLKQYGFNNVRIPVAWSNMIDISDDGMKYTVNEDYLNRVEEVINYCLNDEMYVIVNIHYDGDWWGQFGDADQSVRDKAWARYEQIWTQVAERYKEYSDRLIFESANEELGDRLNDDWVNRSTTNKTGTLTVAEQYETLNAINQKFVDIVRETGGNNTNRYLLIAGYSTNIDSTCKDDFVMPTDWEENGVTKLSVSVHYYTPWNYCGGSEYHQGEGDAARLYDWGTEEDIEEMHTYLDKMKKFTDAGYGVIIGEYGVQTTASDGIPTYLEEVGKYALENGMIPVLWDNGTWFNRAKNVIAYDNVAQAIKNITGAEGISKTTGVDTAKPSYSVVTDESSLQKIFTWEGEWKKNGGDGNSYITPSISGTTNDGTNDWTYHSNTWGFWMVIYSEALKNVDHLYIRATCKDNDIDSSTLQLSYAEFSSSYLPETYGLYEDTETMFETTKGALEHCSNGKETDISAEDEWSGKLFSIDEDMLNGNSILWISASNKPVFTKIELFTDKQPEPETPAVEAPVTTPATETPATVASEQAVTVIQATTEVKSGKAVYSVTSDSKKTVEYTAPTSKKVTTAVVPAAIKVDGTTYKVTSIAKNAFKGNKKLKKVTIAKNVKTIGANAFSGCTSLKNVVIQSKSLSTIGKNAFKGIQKKAVFTVPKAKYKAYKKLLSSKTGYKKTMKIKKA